MQQIIEEYRNIISGRKTLQQSKSVKAIYGKEEQPASLRQSHREERPERSGKARVNINLKWWFYYYNLYVPIISSVLDIFNSWANLSKNSRRSAAWRRKSRSIPSTERRPTLRKSKLSSRLKKLAKIMNKVSSKFLMSNPVKKSNQHHNKNQNTNLFKTIERQ